MIRIFIINSEEIKITKGDSAELEIWLANPDGERYELRDGDAIVFSVKRRANGKNPIVLQKEGVRIFLSAEDTINIPDGKYLYDVALYGRGGDVTTVIGPSLFEVMPMLR